MAKGLTNTNVAVQSAAQATQGQIIIIIYSLFQSCLVRGNVFFPNQQTFQGQIIN